MIGYYETSKGLYDYLIADQDINEVKVGALDSVDTNKKTMFPLAHVLISSFREPINGLTEYDVTVSLMDIVDVSKVSLSDIAKADRWKGNDNKQDILNTLGAVMKKLTNAIRSGTIAGVDYELIGIPQAEIFEDRFENLLTGWSRTFTIQVVNTVNAC